MNLGRVKKNFSTAKLSGTAKSKKVADSMIVNQSRSIPKMKESITGYPKSLVGVRFVTKRL
jgi:hypothetical protein